MGYSKIIIRSGQRTAYHLCKCLPVVYRDENGDCRPVRPSSAGNHLVQIISTSTTNNILGEPQVDSSTAA